MTDETKPTDVTETKRERVSSITLGTPLRTLTISRDRYMTNMVNVLVDDKIENVYRGIEVTKNQLIGALIETGVLDDFIADITEVASKVIRGER